MCINKSRIENISYDSKFCNKNYEINRYKIDYNATKRINSLFQPFKTDKLSKMKIHITNLDISMYLSNYIFIFEL